MFLTLISIGMFTVALVATVADPEYQAVLLALFFVLAAVFIVALEHDVQNDHDIRTTEDQERRQR